MIMFMQGFQTVGIYVMSEVEINDDVFNEDWTRLFFRIVFTEEDGIRLVPFEFDESR